jgi:hypothetical protein
MVMIMSSADDIPIGSCMVPYPCWSSDYTQKTLHTEHHLECPGHQKEINSNGHRRRCLSFSPVPAICLSFHHNKTLKSHDGQVLFLVQQLCRAICPVIQQLHRSTCPIHCQIHRHHSCIQEVEKLVYQHWSCLKGLGIGI